MRCYELEKHYGINKYVSIIHRLGMVYFDHELAPYQIASGQQFFLLHISEHPGISILELATHGEFDKGTCARAVQKLEDVGYIYRKVDPFDKRIQRLYTSEHGERVVCEIRSILHAWEDILLRGVCEEDIVSSLKVVKNISMNASNYIRERKKEHNEQNHHK